MRRFVVGSAAVSIAMFPITVAHSTDAPRKPDQRAIVRQVHVDNVFSELHPKMSAKSDVSEIMKISETIVDECDKLGVDYLFVLAIIEAESNFDVEAVSPTGARGLMQIMPPTFREVSNAKRMFDPVENVRAGIRYVAKIYSLGITYPEGVLLAYNQGPGTVFAVWKKEISIPNEAKVYIPKVMNKYRQLLAKNGKDPKKTKTLFLIAQK